MKSLSLCVAVLAAVVGVGAQRGYCDLLPATAMDRKAVSPLHLAEHVQLSWERQMVSYSLTFAPGQCHKDSILLADGNGAAMTFQLSDVVYQDDRGFIKSATIHFLTDLEKMQAKEFGVYYGDAPPKSKPVEPETDLHIASAGQDPAWAAGPATMEISNSRMAVRVAAGARKYEPPILSVDAPAAIQSVKGPDGLWRGRGYLDTYWRVKSYEAKVLAAGPVFVEVQVTYKFEQDKTYVATLRLISQMDWMLVSEEMNLGPRCKFVFDCSSNFAPDRLGMMSPGAMLSRDLNYFDDVLQARMVIWTQGAQLYDFRDALGVYQQDGNARDFLGAFVYRPGEWTRAKVNFAEFWERRQIGDDFLTREELTREGKTDAMPSPLTAGLHGKSVYGGHFTWEFSLYDGRRQWGLTAIDKAAAMGEKGSPRMRTQFIRAGWCPLDRYKDMVLDWDAGDYHQKAASPSTAPAASAPATGRGAGRSGWSVAERVQGYVQGFGSSGWGPISPVAIRGIAPSCYRYDQERQDGLYSPKEEKLIRASYAFLAYVLHDKTYYPWDKSMLPMEDPEGTEPLYGGMCNQNFNTDRYNTVGRIGLSLKTHPQSKVWRDHFLQQLGAQLAWHVYPQSGCWEESVTYAGHVMSTFLPTLQLFRTQEQVNWFGDARLRKLFDFYVKLLTPMNPNFGSRVIPPCGDHEEGTNDREIFRSAAEGFATVDANFAARLMWAYTQEGGKETGAVGPKEQKLISESFQGFGAILRAGDGNDETWLLLRNGESWGHHHCDDCSIQMYAKGSPFITDAGRGSPLEMFYKYDERGHSRISLEDVSLVNFVGRYHRGWIKKEFFSEAADYVLGYTPFLDDLSPRKDGNPALMNPINPGWHERQVLFVRPGYFVVRDTVRTIYREEFNLHFDSNQVVQNGPVVTVTGASGAEMDAIFVTPNPKFEIGQIEGGRRNGGTTTYIKTVQSPEREFLFVLYPRRAGEPSPIVKPLKANMGLTLTTADGNDTIFLSHEPVEYKQGDIEFAGRVGLIRTRGDKTTLSLPDGQKMRYKDVVKQGEDAAEETAPVSKDAAKAKAR